METTCLNDVLAAAAGHAMVQAPADKADRCRLLGLMLSRYSSTPRQLMPPGPSDEELEVMALAALRAPDHKKMIPFRFVVARGAALERLAELFLDYGRRRGKTAEALEDERRRALHAPVLVAVVARIESRDARVPEHEQWACVGGAIANAVMALHVMGYGAKMVSGARARDPAVIAAYCGAGETLVGWIAAGTLVAPAIPRGDVDPATVMRAFAPAG
jgi:nitroreductase